MSVPSKEALELVRSFWPVAPTLCEGYAARIDAFVADRVATQGEELNRLLNLWNKELDRAMTAEGELWIATANLRALRAAADAVAEAAEDGAIDRWSYLRKMVAAYRSLSPATGE